MTPTVKKTTSPNRLEPPTDVAQEGGILFERAALPKMLGGRPVPEGKLPVEDGVAKEVGKVWLYFFGNSAVQLRCLQVV